VLRAQPRTAARRGAPAVEMSGFGGFAKAKDNFKYTGTQRPSAMTPMRKVPKEIAKPDYASDGKPKAKTLGMPWDIPVNSAEDIEGIRKAARAAREVLDIATSSVRVGMTTEELDELVHTETIKRGGYPSPLNYHGFPKSVCTSINEVVCHGIPGTNVKLQDGDIVNIDVTVYLNGYHGDCSEMACVGEVDEAGKKLIQTTYDAWQAAIAICKPGVKYSEIGGVIEVVMFLYLCMFL
jgi:methionyl aminopeptidase